MENPFRPMTRRDAIRAGLMAGAGLAIGNQQQLHGVPLRTQEPVTRPIPKTGERLPIVGLGTNNYSVTEAADLAPRRDVISRMPQLGASVIDTARGYGRSEIVIGEILKTLGTRDRYFLVTKFTASQNSVEAGQAQLREAFERLQVETIDAMLVHNLNGTDVMMPTLREYKDHGRVRYYGTSTSSEAAYPRLLELMRREPMDFIQVDYSIGNRGAAAEILPLAQDRGMAVMINVPFGGRGGRNLFPQVANRPLPGFAAEFGAATWGQFFLKYILSHPAVTVAIPGTTQVRNFEDNAAGMLPPLPDAALRRRMEQYWDTLG